MTLSYGSQNFREGLIGVAQGVQIALGHDGLSIVFERHPSSGHEIPEQFLMVLPPDIAKPMIEHLCEQSRADERPEWLKLH